MTCGFNIYTTALNTYEVHNVQSEMCGTHGACCIPMLPQIYDYTCFTHPQGHSLDLPAVSVETTIAPVWGSVHSVDSTGTQSNHSFFLGQKTEDMIIVTQAKANVC